MRKSLRLPALLLLSLILAAAARAEGPPDRSVLPGIYGKDERRVIEETGPPWSAIGRVNRNIGGFCTGTLIAPDAVLTAAHCLWNRRTGRFLPADGLHFLPGYRQGSYLANRPVNAIRLAPDLAMDEQGRPRNMANDWAILTLKEPLPPNAKLRPIAPAGGEEIKALAAGQPLTRAGYSQDRPHLPTAVACHLTGRTGPRLLRHDCDGTRGDSGSPMLIETADGWRVIGLAIAVATQGGESFGIGITVPETLQK